MDSSPPEAAQPSATQKPQGGFPFLTAFDSIIIPLLQGAFEGQNQYLPPSVWSSEFNLLRISRSLLMISFTISAFLESSSVENKYSAMVLGKTMTEVTMDAAAEIRATERFMSDILPNQTNVRINAGKNKDKKEKISIVTQ